MSINATVQKLVDNLFADQLIKGLEATEKVTWIVREDSTYDPLSGEVTSSERRMEIPVITGSGALSSTDDRSLMGDDKLFLQMQPLEDRTSREALSDAVLHEDREYAVNKIDVVRLGNKPMLWKVSAS